MASSFACSDATLYKLYTSRISLRSIVAKVGFDPLLSGLLSILVFSGGAQFLVASMLTTQASFATTLLMVFFLELRYTLLGASLAGFMKKEKRTFWLSFLNH